MPDAEHIREMVKGPVDVSYIRERQAQGWRLVALEWDAASAPGEQTAGSGSTEITLEEAPFGTRVVAASQKLEENPSEMEFLLSMMELIIQDISLTKVAEELNQRGFRTRRGVDWGPVAVFNMLPRLIELTPRIFASAEWTKRRKRLTPVY
ncbi:MAG: recombinase family protein [Candidatus Acidiferrales bacterium]